MKNTKSNNKLIDSYLPKNRKPIFDISPHISRSPDTPHISGSPDTPHISGSPDTPHVSGRQKAPGAKNTPSAKNTPGAKNAPSATNTSDAKNAPSATNTLCNTETIIKKAINHPVGSSALKKAAAGKQNIVIIADDNTRMTPTDIILPVILNELNEAGIRDEQITLVVASGTHPKMSDAEKLNKFGHEVMNRLTISDHDCNDDTNLVHCGKTFNSIDIYINKQVYDADFRIGVGSVFPHWPAGFGGGGKIILPGVAGKHSADMLHFMGVSDRMSRLGSIEGNNFRATIDDFSEKIGLDFIVNTVMDSSGNICAASAGANIPAHRKAVEYSKRVCQVAIPQKATVVISDSFPSNLDLFQTSKGLFSAELATEKSGIIILTTENKNGLPATHSEWFLKLANETPDNIKEAAANGEIDDVMCASAVLAFKIYTKMFTIYLNSKGFEGYENALSNIGFRLISDLPREIPQIIENSTDNYGIMRQSGFIVPFVKSGQYSRRVNSYN